MRILFLDDNTEILDVFRRVCDPAILKPRSQPIDLFDDAAIPQDDGGFQPVLDLEFKGSFFSKAVEAVKSFEDLHRSPAPFRIAVLDMQLPESSGLEVAKQLLRLDPDINLLFVTAYSDWSVHDIAKTLEKDESQFIFLKKPFEFQEILQMLLYINAKLLRESWQQESLRNLVNFARSYKVDSLEIFNVLLGLQTVELVKTVARKRVPELIRKNEKVLELVEMILTKSGSGMDDTFLLEDLLEEFQDQERIELHYSKKAFQKLQLVGNCRHIIFALRCLVNNGLEYSIDPVKISASEIDGNRVEMTVMDNGLGIQGQFHNEVFEPGFKLEERSSRAGYGLSLVKKVLMTIHKSDLAIRSTLGKGTAIKFTLPCKRTA